MSLSQLVRDRLSQNFGISRDEYNASQELADAVDAASGVMVLVSAVASGGTGATPTLAVTGLKSTDTILAVSQKTAGANSLPLLGWSTVANDAITLQYSAEPGAGFVVVVLVKR